MRSNARLEQAFREAERRRQCLRPGDRGLRRALTQRRETDDVLHIMTGLYARPSYWSTLSNHERIMHVLRAECASHPRWVLGHVSAATVWRLTDSVFLNRNVHWATDLTHASTDRNHYVFHALPVRPVTVVEGMRVTDLHQTLFDCARSLQLPDALAVLEAAMRSGKTDKAQFQAFLETRRGYKGVEKARQACVCANGLSENGGESITLGYLVLWGYAVPEQQVPCVDPITGARRRVDFLWRRDDGKIIIGELDGRGKYVDPAMTAGRDIESIVFEEKDRESNLALDGSVVFVRWTFDQLVRQPELVRRKLDMAGVPRATDRKHGPHAP